MDSQQPNPFDDTQQTPPAQPQAGPQFRQANPFDDAPTAQGATQQAATPTTQQPDVINDTLKGAWQGLGDTVHGVGNLVRGAVGAAGAISPSRLGEVTGAIPKGSTDAMTQKIQEALVRQAGADSLASLSEAQTFPQHVGKFLETAAEMLAGDEAFKSLSLVDKVGQISKVANFMAQHPTAARVLKGAVGGAVGAGTVEGIKTSDATKAAEAAAVGGVAGGALSAAGAGIKAIRAIYAPLETAEAVQPALQSSVRDVVAKAADEAGVTAPSGGSMQTVVSDLADSVKQKAKPLFQQIDAATDGEFSNAQTKAARYRGATDKLGKDAYHEAMQKQGDLFDQAQASGQVDPKSLDEARLLWRKGSALNDVHDALQPTVAGQRPQIAALSGKPQPAEAINPKALLKRLNQTYNEGTLQTALGDPNAKDLLTHVGEASQRIEDIKTATVANKAARKKINYVGYGALGTLGVGGVAEAGAKILGSKESK
jgi:hypothetical protein